MSQTDLKNMSQTDLKNMSQTDLKNMSQTDLKNIVFLILVLIWNLQHMLMAVLNALHFLY